MWWILKNSTNHRLFMSFSIYKPINNRWTRLFSMAHLLAPTALTALTALTARCVVPRWAPSPSAAHPCRPAAAQHPPMDPGVANDVEAMGRDRTTKGGNKKWCFHRDLKNAAKLLGKKRHSYGDSSRGFGFDSTREWLIVLSFRKMSVFSLQRWSPQQQQ